MEKQISLPIIIIKIIKFLWKRSIIKSEPTTCKLLANELRVTRQRDVICETKTCALWANEFQAASQQDASILHCEQTSCEFDTLAVASCETTSLQIASPQAYELGVYWLTICKAELNYVDLNEVI